MTYPKLIYIKIHFRKKFKMLESKEKQQNINLILRLKKTLEERDKKGYLFATDEWERKHAITLGLLHLFDAATPPSNTS